LAVLVLCLCTDTTSSRTHPLLAMAAAADAKKAKMLAKFNQLDANGDGTLDIQELSDLLKKGNPNFTDKEVKTLYDGCDTNHDGKVSFEEFLGYVYKQDRTGGGRHDRLSAASGPAVDESEVDWGPCKETFTAFAGQDMDGKEFMKFCKDAHLLGKGLKNVDVDMIFAKVVPKGKRRMDFTMFQLAVRHIAQKRSQPNGEIQAIVAASAGPVLKGTKTDAVRFYDDKSTYTGAATANENLCTDGVPEGHNLDRHARQQAEAEAAVAGGGDEEDWGGCERVFGLFAGAGGELDGREFLVMVNDIGLLNSKFKKTDVDVVFTGVARKARKIGFEDFKACVRKIATKRGQIIPIVQDLIGQSSGPLMKNVTKTEAVRFFDDKSTYTGAAAELQGAGHAAQGDKHERIAAEAADAAAASENEHPWEDTLNTFIKFAGDDGIDGREFTKLCLDCGLYDTKFTKNDVDIVFAGSVEKGKRKMDADSFCTALRKVAIKKGVATYLVQAKVANTSGPVLAGTKTDAVRFYDDKSTYTGAATANENLMP